MYRLPIRNLPPICHLHGSQCSIQNTEPRGQSQFCCFYLDFLRATSQGGQSKKKGREGEGEGETERERDGNMCRPCGGEGNGTTFQYSRLENPMDGGAWQAAAHGVAKSRTQLSSFTFTFHFHAVEKEMATHSSVLAWGLAGMGEPGGLPSLGSHRVGHN